MPAISIAATACARSLLGYPPEPFSGEGFKPSKECLRVTRDVISVLAPYWSCLAPFIVRPSQQLQPDFELVSNADSFPDHQKNVNRKYLAFSWLINSNFDLFCRIDSSVSAAYTVWRIRNDAC